MQCQRWSERVGPGFRPGTGHGYEARCSYDAVEQFDGEHLCRRHVNLAKRDKAIAEYLYANNLYCPEHPSRRLRTGDKGRILFCSAWVDGGTSRYCSYKHDLPQSFLDEIKRLQKRKG